MTLRQASTELRDVRAALTRFTASLRKRRPQRGPAQVLGFRSELVLVQSLASENRYPLPLVYSLRPFDSGEPAFLVKERPNRPIDSAQPTVAPEKRRLSTLIDAMLLAGDMTMKGILRELRRKASAACRGKNLRANIRARL